MTDRWYPPSKIKYTASQVKWLIPILPMLREGEYPPEPVETGYIDLKISGKGGVKHSPFERAVLIATELDIRLEKAGIAGIILELKYSGDNSNDIYMNQHIANMLDMGVDRVIYLSKKGMSYICGKHRKSGTFDEYNWHKKSGSIKNEGSRPAE